MGVSITTAQHQQLLGYVALVEKWNRSINLVSRRDIDRLRSRHVLDSMSVSVHLLGKSILDVGTGAGLPGIPLAIVNPQRQFTLCDRMAKRIRFLQVVKSQLELTNVELLEQDFGAATTPKCFDTAVARAVAPAGKLWPMLEPALNPGGRVVVFSSTQMETADPVPVGGGEDITYHYRIERVAVPGSDQPHVVEVLERH